MDIKGAIEFEKDTKDLIPCDDRFTWEEVPLRVYLWSLRGPHSHYVFSYAQHRYIFYAMHSSGVCIEIYGALE